MAPDSSLTPAQRRTVARLRMAAQLSPRPDETPGDVVRRMMAMQAQDYASAKWAVGVRLPRSTDAQVEAAIVDGSIVRSWPMRGTLHLMAPEDLGWVLSLTSERLVRGAASRRANLGLTLELLETAREAAIGALRGGRSLSRDDMHEVFGSVGISPDGQRGYHVLWYLSQTATLCQGPAMGKQNSFVLLDEWVKSARTLERDEALGELTRRYFLSHGPATIKDFAWWSSLTLTEARRGLAVARGELDELLLGGESYFLAPGLHDAEAEERPGGSFALPSFDENLLGYQNRDAVLPVEYAERVVPGKNGMFLATMVRDGIVEGTWRRKIGAKAVTVVPSPFRALGASATKSFERAAADYAAFLELPLRVGA